MTLYSIGIVAKHYGVSPSTIRRWAEKGLLAVACRTLVGHRRFDLQLNPVANAVECKHCGHKAQADQNGALNLLLRVNDPEYRRYMTKEAVKKLERGRYEAWCKSRQEEPIKETSNKKRLKKAA